MKKLLSKRILESNFFFFFFACYHFETNSCLGKHKSLLNLDISTKGHFEKQVFNPFDFQKVLIDENSVLISTSLMIHLKF